MAECLPRSLQTSLASSIFMVSQTCICKCNNLLGYAGRIAAVQETTAFNDQTETSIIPYLAKD